MGALLGISCSENHVNISTLYGYAQLLVSYVHIFIKYFVSNYGINYHCMCLQDVVSR